MADLTYCYAADITKSERDEHGDLYVFGKATGSDRDGDGQRADPAWLRTAMPAWQEWSNLREMHQPIAAGIGVELTNDGDDWYIKSKVIDPNTARKIEAGLLKGYSIGIKSPIITRRDGDEWITGGSVVEVSYVDRPCLSSAKTMICKSVGIANQMQPVEASDADVEQKFTPADMAKIVNKNVATTTTTSSGAYTITTPSFTFTAGNGDVAIEPDLDKGAMAPLKPGGPPRYPINSVQDLKDAIHAIGRGKASDKAEIKAHIKSEAKRLGRSDLIPDTWKAVGADLTKEDGATHDPSDLRDILQGLINCMKAELDELASGEQELGDIRQLLETVSMFCCWWQSEAWAGETTSPYQSQEASAMTLAANPDQTKAVETDAAPDAPEADATKTAQPDETKAVEPTAEAAETAPQTPEPQGSDNLAELVKSAIADALKPVTEAAEEREKALTAELATVKADLAKALALPEPGGPVITRTADQAAAARKSDALRLTAEADELLRKADVTASYDQYMAQGYRERAELLRKQAAI